MRSPVGIAPRRIALLARACVRASTALDGSRTAHAEEGCPGINALLVPRVSSSTPLGGGERLGVVGIGVGVGISIINVFVYCFCCRTLPHSHCVWLSFVASCLPFAAPCRTLLTFLSKTCFFVPSENAER